MALKLDNVYDCVEVLLIKSLCYLAMINAWSGLNELSVSLNGCQAI